MYRYTYLRLIAEAPTNSIPVHALGYGSRSSSCNATCIHDMHLILPRRNAAAKLFRLGKPERVGALSVMLT